MPRTWEKPILSHLEVSKIKLATDRFDSSALWFKSVITLLCYIQLSAPVLESTIPDVLPSEDAVQNQISLEQKDTSGSGDQEVDLSDTNKYCTLCSASFNNPLVAQQHYSGRKHQRNQARQETMDQMGEQSDHGRC